ncbi:MAG: hypothetical protein HY423_08720 [Candidatus Lambdaproteobacteria bacterium]|nr:hypothetical protein [Candidatus Lambdaproteobacteria bacterium]
MNLFRSEGHARNWSGFKEEAKEGLLPLEGILHIFSSSRYRERLNGHYITSMADYNDDLKARTRQATGGSAFWGA